MFRFGMISEFTGFLEEFHVNIPCLTPEDLMTISRRHWR